MDPIYALATPFRANELKSANKKLLMQPLSYDRTVIESRWRQRSRNRMRTNRRTPLVSSDLSSIATSDSGSLLENGIVAAKKSRLNDSVPEDFNENVVPARHDTDTVSDGSDSGNSELTGSTCPVSNDMQCGNSFSSSYGAFESNDVSTGEPQYHDSGVQVVTANTGQEMNGSFTVKDCWWNNVDSRTWLQGVQTYLLLHSASNVETRRMPVAVLSPNVTPYTVIANPASGQQVTTSVIVESPTDIAGSLQKEHQIARPVFAPFAGYRVSTNGVLSAVPVYYFPVVNYSVCEPTSASSAVACQETYIGGQRSSMAAVDLVSFMHNYCLPPARTQQSSVNAAVVQTFAGQAQNLGVSCGEGDGSLLLATGVAPCEEQSVPAVPQQSENSHLGSWPMMPTSSDCNMVGNVSRNGVYLTPRSLSSIGLAECWTDDAVEVTSGSSTVVVDSCESAESIDVKSSSSYSTDTDLTVPGWFGKGLSIRRSKRRMSRQS